MRNKPLNPEIFKNNRSKVLKSIKPNSLVVLSSNPIYPTSADGTFPFVQHTDLFYLTGIAQEETYLILAPDAKDPNDREILFVRETNEHIAVWEGERLSKEQATQNSGIARVEWNQTFHHHLNLLAYQTETIYLNLNEHLRHSSDGVSFERAFIKDIKQRFPLHRYERINPILHEVRSVKSNLEIELMQTACDITEKAFRRILQFIKPGVMEYEIEAEIIHEFISNKAMGFAYEPIIAAGKDSCVLHYVLNNKECKDGDILLMDFGSRYGYYSSDLTRTIPVSGTYTPRQKEVYNAVLTVQKEAISLLKPGIQLKEYNKEIGQITERELVKLGLIDKVDLKNQDPNNPLYKKYFMHGTAHFIGLDTHDYGFFDQPLPENVVVTCEPGIYIPEESIGVRIENDIFVTKNGPIDLMKNIPREVEEIEDLMN